MAKTPEELAEEYSKFDAATDIGTDLGSYRQGLFEGYLAGYQARDKEVAELKTNWTFCCEDKARLIKELGQAEAKHEAYVLAAEENFKEMEAEIDSLQAKLSDAGILTTEHIVGASKVMNSPEKPDGCNSSNNSNGWISVKDRLPGIDQTVVVAVLFKAKEKRYCTLENNCQEFVGGYEFYVAELVVEPNKLIKWVFAHTKVDLSSRITHWMPLPQPPKE